MSETLQSDDVINRAQELESYINQSQIALKALRSMREDAEQIVGSLNQKKDELSRHEQDLVDYLKKLQLVSQKADALLTPIVDQKQELDELSKKLADGIASIDGLVQKTVEPLGRQLEEKLKAIADELHATNETLHKEVNTSAASLRQNQDILVKNLSPRIDGCEKLGGSQKAALEEQRQAIEREGKNTLELRKAVQELKGSIEKQLQELKTQSEKQRAELTGLVEKQKGELGALISELSEKHIKVLEKDSAQIKSALNAIIGKLGNVHFKKLLGL